MLAVGGPEGGGVLLGEAVPGGLLVGELVSGGLQVREPVIEGIRVRLPVPDGVPLSDGVTVGVPVRLPTGVRVPVMVRVAAGLRDTDDVGLGPLYRYRMSAVRVSTRMEPSAATSIPMGFVRLPDGTRSITVLAVKSSARIHPPPA